MLDLVFVLMFSGALIFMVLAFRDQKNIAWPVIAIIFLLMCMVGSLNVETGYSFIRENTEWENGYEIVSGVREHDRASPLAIVFLGLVLIMIVLLIYQSVGGLAKT